jgi:23S rRNA (uracil-5-)-methyltransferase RumA
MKKGDIIEGRIERVDFPNKGKFMFDDREITVKNTIPGQKLSVQIRKKKKGRAEGVVSEVLEKAPNEIESKCPHFGPCGGCNYQNLPYEDQLKIKEGQVRKLIDQVYLNRGEVAEEEYTFEEIRKSPSQFAYRNKMEFSFGDAYLGGPLSLGMHKRGSFYDIVDVDGCKIVDEDYSLILRTTLEFFRGRNASFYHCMRHEGFLRNLLIRQGKQTGEILIALITSTQEMSGIEEWGKHILELEKEGKLKSKIAGILHTKNDSLANVVQSDETDILYGKDYFYEELLGMKFKVSQFSFFQTNSLGAEVLYDTAREYIGELADEDGEPNKVLFDLYSGTGTIAQMMSPVAKEVVGVEIVEEAVEAAKENAKLNKIDNCRFIAGDVLKVLDDVTEKPDFIILDPPRNGIHPKALAKIIDYGVDRLLYISCKPTSLARDLEVFLDNGYKVEKLCPVDMFPGTVHVETVCLLHRRNI